MEIVANILLVIGTLIILLCMAGFARSKNIFLSAKLVFIANIYGLSILLIGFVFKNLSITIAVKAFVLIVLNIIITIIINHLIIKKSANELN